ncbi:MAG TPA: hypothetical protein VM577_06360 [Anaerovoracaceae bacterium]|nr:hypothetical protein [Anaerovoracaceae bacterium]
MKTSDSEIDGELDGYPLTDERLNEIETYEITCIKAGKEGLKLNGRFVLSMIRELRALREVVATTRRAVFQFENIQGALAKLDGIELLSRNPHDERWRK